MARSEHILDGIIHRIVEYSIKRTLVGSNIGGVSVEALSHLENSGALSILAPEVFGYLRDSIDSNSIETVGIDQILYPVLKVASNPVIRLVEVGQVGKSAVFYLPLVSPVLNLAVVMIMLGVIEGIN